MDLKNSKYLNGMKLEDCQFENRGAMVEAMQDKRYATDPEYRALVGHMCGKPFLEDAKNTPKMVAGEATLGAKHLTQEQPAAGFLSGQGLNRAMADVPNLKRLEDGLIAREQYQKMFMAKDEENGGLLYENSPTYRRQVEDWLKANTAAVDAQVGGAIIDRNLPQHRHAMRVTIGANVSEFENIKQGVRDQDVAQAKADLAAKHAALDAGQPIEHRDLGGRTV